MVYCNPYILGWYNPQYTSNNQVFFIAHLGNTCCAQYSIQRGIVIYHTWFIPTFPPVYPHNAIRLSTCMSMCIWYVSNIPNRVWFSWLSELSGSSRVYIYLLCIYPSTKKWYPPKNQNCPPHPFRVSGIILIYFGYGWCQKNVCNPYAYAFLCYHLYIHEPIILHHTAPMVIY